MNREFWKRVWWYVRNGSMTWYPDDEPIEVTMAKVDALIARLERNKARRNIKIDKEN